MNEINLRDIPVSPVIFDEAQELWPELKSEQPNSFLWWDIQNHFQKVFGLEPQKRKAE